MYENIQGTVPELLMEHISHVIRYYTSTHFLNGYSQSIFLSWKDGSKNPLQQRTSSGDLDRFLCDPAKQGWKVVLEFQTFQVLVC